jgi:hypothetical protein
MKVYEVEEMAGETPISRQIVPTDTPLEAAAVGTSRYGGKEPRGI